MKKLLLIVVASIVFTGCGGGGGDSDDEHIDHAYLDPEYTPYVPRTHVTDVNAEATIKKADTSLYSIGVIDTGLHVDRLDSHVIPILYNEEHERDLLEGHERVDWVRDFAPHGTAVADTASRYAKNSSIVFAMHRKLANWDVQVDDFREREFTNTTIKVILGEHRSDGIPFDQPIVANDRGDCVRGISGVYDNDDKCLSHDTYWIKEILLAPVNSTNPVVAINMSFGSPFLTAANSIFTNETMEEWERRNVYEAWESGKLRSVGGMRGHGDRTELRRLLAENDVVLVHAPGNDKENMTEVTNITFYLTLKSQDHDGSFNTLVNNFYDFDHDDNGNGVIENDERGVTEAYIAVGGGHVNDDGKFERNPNSAYPGEDKNIQSRFIIANWEVKAKDAYSEYELYFGGTSFSAPQVTGAIVLLKSLFPLKTAREIAQAILDSGNKNFKDYNPELHGQGFLDVGAAELLLLEE